MPSPSRCLTAGDALAFVRESAVNQPTSPPRVGLELEWLTFSTTDRSRRLTLAEIESVTTTLAGALPCGSRLTVEPGAQVEISTLPFASIDDAIDAATTDTAALRAAFADIGVELVGAGLDRCRPPTRILDTSRYRAMEAYFDHAGPEGRAMMCNSASMQINVDFDGNVCDAWRAGHLVAKMFGQTCSEPHPNRLDLWARIDRSRTAPVGGAHPADAWARYALDARVMFIRTSSDTCAPMLDGMTVGEWIEQGHPLGWPTEADLAEHLTTLFPPVRPRGFLEVRTIDALTDARWPTVAATAASLLFDGPRRRALLEHVCR